MTKFELIDRIPQALPLETSGDLRAISTLAVQSLLPTLVQRIAHCSPSTLQAWALVLRSGISLNIRCVIVAILWQSSAQIATKPVNLRAFNLLPL